MFRVLVNRSLWRVLVTGKEEDLDLLEDGWELAGEYKRWRDAYKVAFRLAEAHDYILEWYLEEVA